MKIVVVRGSDNPVVPGVGDFFCWASNSKEIYLRIDDRSGRAIYPTVPPHALFAVLLSSAFPDLIGKVFWYTGDYKFVILKPTTGDTLQLTAA